MKVTGFTIIRNAVTYDFPIVEAICSALPLCDEFIVAIGNSEDDTVGLIRRIPSDKIKIAHSVWDDSLREGGAVLAAETDKAFALIPDDTDWCLYLQADEVIHEADHEAIYNSMLQYKDDPRVDGLLFNYLHFYGSYNYVSADPSSFKSEIRIIRNNKKIYSYRDAQGFRKSKNLKLNVVSTNARIFHYTKVKDPSLMQKKHIECSRYWYNDAWIAEHLYGSNKYDFSQHLLTPFTGTHPKVMLPRIAQTNWTFEQGNHTNKFSIKQQLKRGLEAVGIDLSYRNYKLLK